VPPRHPQLHGSDLHTRIVVRVELDLLRGFFSIRQIGSIKSGRQFSDEFRAGSCHG
jgi:hypothetical protein